MAKRFVLVLSTILLNLPLFAFAEHAPPSTISQSRLAIYRAAGADTTQEAKLIELTREFEAAVTPKARSLVKLLQEMRSLSRQADPDPQMVLKKQDEINRINSEMSLARITLTLQMRHVLTAEQRKKLIQLIEQNSANDLHPNSDRLAEPAQ